MKEVYWVGEAWISYNGKEREIGRLEMLYEIERGTIIILPFYRYKKEVFEKNHPLRVWVMKDVLEAIREAPTIEVKEKDFRDRPYNELNKWKGGIKRCVLAVKLDMAQEEFERYLNSEDDFEEFERKHLRVYREAS
ncbi:hypothetical protein HYV50_02680 [Candidatus Pacearchaeota archaeon]|nr:hypothetical protein [Candidatus Pacearchaeota archaeon]